MEAVLAVFHVLVALGIIVIVLIQDPKSGNMGMFGGGGGSNSIFGASGAPSFLSKMTRWLGVLFAITCIGLTIATRPDVSSVTDELILPNQSEVPAVPVGETPTETAPPAGDQAPADVPAENQ